MKKGNLIILSGVSGVGKNTIIKELFDDPSLNMVYSISMTTRSMRPNEVNGNHYFFVNNEEFDKAIANNELLEWAEFCHNRYGTPRKFVETKLKEGKNVVLEIEVKGALNVMKLVPEAISIFILPPSLDELSRRLRERATESDEVIEARIIEAQKELTFKDYYKHLVVNDTLVKAVNEIKKIVKREQK